MEGKAMEQADGLDDWAAVLEAHKPEGAAAGIVMLREAAKTLRELSSADAPEGPWEELIKAATLYISALKYLIEGHHKGDGWERLMAIRDSVKVQEERWENALGAVRDALNRLDAHQEG